MYQYYYFLYDVCYRTYLQIWNISLPPKDDLMKGKALKKLLNKINTISKLFNASTIVV